MAAQGIRGSESRWSSEQADDPVGILSEQDVLQRRRFAFVTKYKVLGAQKFVVTFALQPGQAQDKAADPLSGLRLG